MNKPVVTSATSEPIQAGRFARCSIGVRGIVPCRIVNTTPRGAVVVQPLNQHEPKWDDPRAVPADDVWFLLTKAEVKALELPA